MTETVQMTAAVKEEEEERYDYMIACQDEEKPSADLCCKTERDVTEDFPYHEEETHFAECKTETDSETGVSSDETLTLQTAVEIEVKKEEDEEENSNAMGLGKSLQFTPCGIMLAYKVLLRFVFLRSNCPRDYLPTPLV